MKKIAYLMAGYGGRPRYAGYLKIGKEFRAQGITPRRTEIRWEYGTMSGYVEQFMEKFDPRAESYFLGFSFGAMIALLAAAQVKPKAIILCSLSPYFKEIPSVVNKEQKEMRLGKRRMTEFKKLSLNQVTQTVEAKTILLVGSKEMRSCKTVARKAHELLPGSRLIVVEGARHNPHEEEYLSAILKVVRGL